MLYWIHTKAVNNTGAAVAIKAETGEFWPYIMWAEIYGGKKSKSHGPPLLLV